MPVVAERDGHEFIAAALADGAAAYLTAGPAAGGTAIVVDDTVRALQAAGRLARDAAAEPGVRHHRLGRQDLGEGPAGRGAAASGSCTAASAQSFNNELGVPLTLLNAPDGTEAVVVEMGARGVGHIAELCAHRAPDGRASSPAWRPCTPRCSARIDEVARAKGELVEALPASGTPILNAGRRAGGGDGRRAPTATVVTYGEGGDVRAEDVALDDDLRAHVRLASPWGDAEVALAVRGRHQVENALAAAAAGLGRGHRRRGGGAGPRARPRCRRGGWSWPRRRAARWSSTTPTTPTPRRWRPRSSRWPRSRPDAASRCSA